MVCSFKVNEMWVKWKTKIRNWLNGHRPFHILPVKPINASGSSSYIKTQYFQMFLATWNLIDSFASMIGISAFREVDLNARMVLTGLVICSSFASLFYTMYIVWPSITLLLEAVCMLGTLLPGTLKFRWVLKDAKHVFAMNKFFESFLVNHPTGRRADDLDNEMKDAYTASKMFSAVSLTCYVIFALYPVKAYVMDGRLVPLMRAELPFVDQTNMKGYLIGVSFILFIGIYGIVGNLAFDLTVAMLSMQYKSLVTLLIHDLGSYYELSDKGKTCSTQYQDKFLKNICMKYNEIHSYLRHFETKFSTMQCHSICALYGSLICAVYATLNNGWISGYGFSIFCFIQLYVQYIFGTFVNIQNDRMSQAFYFTPWYEYPVRVQRVFSMLMHASTFDVIELQIGPLAPLNVETGLVMTKSIFSYYTTISSLT